MTRFSSAISPLAACCISSASDVGGAWITSSARAGASPRARPRCGGASRSSSTPRNSSPASGTCVQPEHLRRASPGRRRRRAGRSRRTSRATLRVRACPQTRASPDLERALAARAPWRPGRGPCRGAPRGRRPARGRVGSALSSCEVGDQQDRLEQRLEVRPRLRRDVDELVSPPHSDGTRPRSTICVRTRCGSASSLSILLTATMIGTPAAFAWSSASTVCGITPSSAATTRTTMSVTWAPRARIAVKASWPGVSMNVISRPPTWAWYAPMCWVIPPNSPATTSVLRIASSSFVLPWSTWPMTVTTGERGTSLDSSTSSSSSSASSSSSTPTISTA